MQCLTAGAIAVPQLMQNLAPAGFGVAHDAHAGPAAGAGAGAALAVPAAPALLLLLLHGAGHHPRQREAGREERALGRPAALGHALAGAERHLAGRVLLEAAGQLGVRGVLGELLELACVLSARLMSKLPIRVTASPYASSCPFAEVIAACSISGECTDRPRIGHPLATTCVVTLVRSTLSSCWLTQPAICSLSARRRWRSGW